jgi:hypothetical protein
MSKNDGGPAFPQAGFIMDHGDTILPPVAGMPLRDWFAGQALMGICANTDWTPTDAHLVARDAYAHADAMLKEREQQ